MRDWMGRQSFCGPQGIAIAQKERPGLILLDIMMPGMDGFEVCKQLRIDPTLRHTPIVLMTAMALPDLEAKGLEAGATLSIRKPFNPEQVVSTVEQLLGRPRNPATPRARRWSQVPYTPHSLAQYPAQDLPALCRRLAGRRVPPGRRSRTDNLPGRRWSAVPGGLVGCDLLEFPRGPRRAVDST